MVVVGVAWTWEAVEDAMPRLAGVVEAAVVAADAVGAAVATGGPDVDQAIQDLG